jgi:hypothetical protein
VSAARAFAASDFSPQFPVRCVGATFLNRAVPARQEIYFFVD